MSTLADKAVTGFFVAVLGMVWFFTRQCEIPHPYRIAVYDRHGYRVKLGEIRTEFRTYSAAVSFARNYENSLPDYKFVPESCIPRLKRGLALPRRDHR